MGFWPSDFVLLAVQAGTVAVVGPRAPAWLRSLRGGAWAWILPLSLGGTIALLAVLPDAAAAYTWLALLATPPLAAITLSGSVRLRAPAVAAVALLLLVAWRARSDLAGDAGAVAITALSCPALAAGLAVLAPRRALQVGILAMAVLDAILVFSHGLQHPNQVLNAAAPAAGLPRLQLASFGSAVMGYGDLLVAAVLGATLVSAPRRRLAAVATFAFAGLFDLLFLVTDELPATVPVALAMLAVGALERRRALRSGRRPAGRPRPAAAEPAP